MHRDLFSTSSQMISPAQFNFKWFSEIPTQKNKVGNQANKRQRKYFDIVTAFDVETSRLNGTDTAFLYHWQWQFGLQYTVTGRTWTELERFINKLIEYIPSNVSLVVLVHNLSYEFQFLRTIYDFAENEVFALDKRKVLKCTMYDNRLELRCTYLHSNMSLAAYTKKMDVEHKKLDSEDYDHTITRYPWTELTDKELMYCQNDVLGLVEAYTKEMVFDNDVLSSIPLTSTGYVRRDVKRAMRMCGLQWVHKCQPDIQTYTLLKEAFRGGDTHANRFFTGKIVENVSSADRSSSYPDVLCNCKFPVGKFVHLESPTLPKVKKLMKHNACVFRVAFWGIRQKDAYWGFPYLSRSKCRYVVEPIQDNGRILSADYLETTITDVDWRIVEQQYEWEHIKISDCDFTKYGYLPAPLVLTCIEYYRAKTELKGVGEAGSYEEMLYNKKKALLNAIYGCMAQDQCKQSVVFDGHVFVDKEDDIVELLTKNSRRAYLCYAWGVWITAWARLRLQEGLVLAGDNAVYCDTDSVKYVGEIDWTEYNNARIKSSKRNHAYADDKHGVTHYMGVFEFEGTYKQFCTLGAKKYVYTDDKDEIHLTVSGVNKKKGAVELAESGGMVAFKEGMIFRDAGGTESVYNDDVPRHTITVDGHELEIGPNVCIKPSTYTLGITAEYARLLENPSKIYT